MTHWTKAAVLFFLLLVCGAGFVVTQHVREHQPPPAPRELFAVVNEQLEAFRSSDFKLAYHQAATGVQQRFTLAQFEKMVRQRYPEMTRGARVEFGQVKVRGASAVVQVFIVSADRSMRSFLYSLLREENSWRINSVEELPDYLPEATGTHA